MVQWVSIDLTPSVLITTISPGLMSRTNSAPKVSSAQLSDETIHPPPSVLPRQRGRKPLGSRKAISFVAVITTQEYAPLSVGIIFSIASSVLLLVRRAETIE